MQLNILGGSYQHKYLDVNNSSTINWYPVMTSQQEQAKNQLILEPTAGLSVYTTISGRYYRGGFVARTTKYERCFVVIDQTLWEINQNKSATNRGTLSQIANGTTRCKLICNGNQEVGIFHNTAAYVFNMDTNTLTQITNANYPGGASSIDYIDGYGFIVANGQVYFSNPNSFLNWTGSQVYHPTFKASNTIAVVAFRDKIFNFSSETIEPYYEDGSTAIWARYPTGIVYTGLLHANVISVYDSGIIWVGKSKYGQNHIYMLTNEWTVPQPISEKDPSIQWKINSISDCLNEAWTDIQKTKDGHVLFRLYIPALNTTLCYDVNTNYWFEQQSINPAPNVDGAYTTSIFRGIQSISFNGLTLYGDLYSGIIFYEDYTNQTENGNYITRTRSVMNLHEEDFKQISATQFELDATKGVGTLSGQGSAPIIMLQISKDGGRTYSQPRNLILNNFGDYLYRSRINKLGTARNWGLQLIVTDPIDLMIQNAYAKGSIASY